MRKTHKLARSPLTIRRPTPPTSTTLLSSVRPSLARIYRQQQRHGRLHTTIAPPPAPLQPLPLEANPLFAIYLTARDAANADRQPKTGIPSTYQQYLINGCRKHNPNMSSSDELPDASAASEISAAPIDMATDPVPAAPSAPASPSASRFRSRIPVRCRTSTSGTPPSPSLPTIVDAEAEATNATADDEELWVFGYGSLVWKVDFPVADSQTGYIKGFHRRFYQHSIDHRGTPERPGRVVTLVPDSTDDSVPAASTPLVAGEAAARREARVYGVAHRIPHEQRAAVIRHLDHREKNGYDRRTVDFYPYPSLCPRTGAPLPRRSICLYLATADNESFAGPLEMPRLAEQVFAASGPSGANVEYVYRLADAMREMFPGERDEHLFELERQLRVLEARNAPHA